MNLKTLSQLQTEIDASGGKYQLTYNDLQVVAQHIVASIPRDCSLVAILRGGSALGQLVAYYTAKPLHVFYPSIGEVYPPLPPGSLPVFIEDVVAQGRTYNIVAAKFQDFLFAPAVIDAGMYPLTNSIVSLVTKTWVVFPHENFDLTLAGDRGMFRDGTSQNSKAIL